MSKLKEKKKESLSQRQRRAELQEQNLKSKALKFKRDLKERATIAEKTLLKYLKDSTLKVESQYIIPLYKKIGKKSYLYRFFIVDFCYPQLKFIIELDGKHHHTSAQSKKDRIRTSLLKKEGYRVLRFENQFILETSKSEILSLINKSLYESKD